LAPDCGLNTDRAQPRWWSGSTHHDDAQTTRPTQYRAPVPPPPGRPRRRSPQWCKSAPIMHARQASQPCLRVCEHLSPSSCHRSSRVLAPARTLPQPAHRHQIAIEPAASPVLSLPRLSCIVGLPTPADAACGCGRDGRHPQTFTRVRLPQCSPARHKFLRFQTKSPLCGERAVSARSRRSRTNARDLRDPIVLRMASPGFLLI
jgi:hypothetical protein